MLENVVAFHSASMDFPDLFPRASFVEVSFAVARNQPESVPAASYDYILKENDPNPSAVSIIVQSGGNVLYNPAKGFGDEARLKKWVSYNLAGLRIIGTQRETPLIIVGKIGTNGKLNVYYVIEEDHIFFDTLSIRARLRMHGETSPLGSGIEIKPHLEEVRLVVDRNSQVVDMPALAKYPSTKWIVGFPAHAEPREDSVTPRLFSSAVHMKFFSFLYRAG